MIASLTKKELIEIHDDIVKFNEEEINIISKNKLNSIITKHKKAKGIVGKVAILLHDTPNLQPFEEGNKRTAFASAMIFLKYNKKKLKLSRKKIEEIIIYSVNNNITLKNIEKILKEAII